VLVRTDDEVYRVDSVWLGPPRATFPWRARYVSYGLGLLVVILVMFVQRRIGIGLDFFSVAWALVLTVVSTRFLGQRIDYERPLGQVIALFCHEVRGPRERTGTTGGLIRSRHVRVGPAARSRRPGRTPSRPATVTRTSTPTLTPTLTPTPRTSWPSGQRRGGADRRGERARAAP
jgi:hypothetical protein